MGVIVTGAFVCISWLALDDEAADAIEQGDVTLQTVVTLMAGQRSIWGMTAGQTVTLAGSSLRERALPTERLAELTQIQARIDAAHEAAVEAWPRNPEDDEDAWEPFPNPDDQLHLLSAAERAMLETAGGWDRPVEASIALPPAVDAAEDWTGPESGRWLVLVRHAAHCWAALRGIDRMAAGEVDFSWTRITLPGVASILMATPFLQGRPFDLVYPPSPERPRQAVRPTLASSEEDGMKGSPRYAVGVLDGGAMRWLDLPPGDYSATTTPTTSLFRARLDLFRRELAARGIAYEDDAAETGYELRWAIEDGGVPADFHEPEAVIAYTVSGEKPGEDKQAQAQRQFDPDGERWPAFDWLRETGAFRMPARVDVAATPLQFWADEDATAIGGTPVNDVWAKAHLTWAALAAGLDGCDPTRPSLTPADRVRAAVASSPPRIAWNAVDAADRVQRAAYILATGGQPDAAIEARLSALRGQVIEALLTRGANAEQAAPKLPPIAPGPYPLRVCAVMSLIDQLRDDRACATLMKDTLAALVEPSERELASSIAAQLGGV